MGARTCASRPMYVGGLPSPGPHSEPVPHWLAEYLGCQRASCCRRRPVGLGSTFSPLVDACYESTKPACAGTCCLCCVSADSNLVVSSARSSPSSASLSLTVTRESCGHCVSAIMSIGASLHALASLCCLHCGSVSKTHGAWQTCCKVRCRAHLRGAAMWSPTAQWPSASSCGGHVAPCTWTESASSPKRHKT